MHPFRAVRRLTRQQLATQPPPKKVSGFNVALKEHEFSQVSVGKFQSRSWTTTQTLKIPIMTNPEKISEGTELVLELEPPAKSDKEKKRSWKDDALQADAHVKRDHQKAAKMRDKGQGSKAPAPSAVIEIRCSRKSAGRVGNNAVALTSQAWISLGDVYQFW